MSKEGMPRLRIGDFVADIPIIQGGMGVGISLANLASAVANEGAIGIISALGLGLFEGDKEKDYAEANKIALRNEIKKAREKTKGIIGINVLVAATDSENLIQGAVEAGIDLVLFGAGLLKTLPAALPLDHLDSLHTKFVPIVSSGRSARITFDLWKKKYKHVPDAVVVEGPMAGGHLGFKREQIDDPSYALENILPDVISTVEPYEQEFKKHIPVIAAGGIYTGDDIYRFFGLGAQGVQMATRFVVTDECDASIEFKEAFIRCRKEDLIIINSPVGLPGRAISNEFLEDVLNGNKKPFNCPWHCLKTCKGVNEAPYCIALALVSAKHGRLKNGFVFAGANAYRTDKIMPVRELIRTLIQEYVQAGERKENQGGLKMEGTSLLEGYSYEEKKVGETDYVFLYKQGIIVLFIPAKHCPDEKIMEVARQTAG
ncbi:MAG: nitronate monooxygenase [Candidatus Firestonebacteria bacterium]